MKKFHNVKQGDQGSMPIEGRIFMTDEEYVSMMPNRKERRYAKRA